MSSHQALLFAIFNAWIFVVRFATGGTVRGLGALVRETQDQALLLLWV